MPFRVFALHRRVPTIALVLNSNDAHAQLVSLLALGISRFRTAQYLSVQSNGFTAAPRSKTVLRLAFSTRPEAPSSDLCSQA
jgi:hypothetical protein